MENVNIKIILTDGREINAELYPSVAPITVENFLKLIDEDKIYFPECSKTLIWPSSVDYEKQNE